MRRFLAKKSESQIELKEVNIWMVKKDVRKLGESQIELKGIAPYVARSATSIMQGESQIELKVLPARAVHNLPPEPVNLK